MCAAAGTMPPAAAYEAYLQINKVVFEANERRILLQDSRIDLFREFEATTEARYPQDFDGAADCDLFTDWREWRYQISDDLYAAICPSAIIQQN